LDDGDYVSDSTETFFGGLRWGEFGALDPKENDPADDSESSNASDRD